MPLPPEDTQNKPEITTTIMEIEDRIAEIDAMCRDFLMIGTVDDQDDVNAFISSLGEYGFAVNDSRVVYPIKINFIG